ncbi:hypothetical protein BCR42DRAFT_190620 [Absidia repens]|uniref:Uncharacterized protein n=1 Tax=Absidia repens TaxID=90262 RepID=A0A1X2IRX3_9FUNG|nr:hypothetical protein BCR42DRAFT_190620 [Absidia repens]
MLLSNTCKRPVKHIFGFRHFTNSSKRAYQDYYLAKTLNDTNILRLHLDKAKHLVALVEHGLKTKIASDR